MDAIEIRLLGAVEARRDDQVVGLRGARQRRLLAHLSLAPGRVRPVDGVITAVWPDGDQPPEPRVTLHTYVSRLRQALGAAGTVTARDGGYVLDVAAGAIDAPRFEELVARARDADEVARIELLGEALSLWHGPALDGFEHEEWARPHAVRLEELRANAVEERAEALLSAGRAAEAVPDLEASAIANPLRDRTHRLWMVALHRGGRQGEALRVYEGYRRRLATDLGLEPSPEMVDLEAAILVAGRAVDAAPAEGDAAARARAVRGYHLGDRIGEGAFAVVHRGTQPAVGREVAIKVIRAELANRPEFVRRFEAEAHLVARLEHPHIVPLYDYWREPGRAYLVMRLLRGGTLERALAERRLALEEGGRMVCHVGAALAAAHRAGVVHRDVKPANIFLDDEGNFFLGDFGIAYEVAGPYQLTDSLSVGSPAYASPEQLRREPVGPPADVHGLAIALFEALTGQLPFPLAHSQADLLAHQLNDPLPSASALRTDLPAELDAVLARATAKHPGDRHPDIEAFAADIDRVLRGIDRSTPARPGVATAVGGGRNPYKGLRSFQEADTRDFCGRQRLVDRLLTRLSGSAPVNRMIAVIGPSGSGKSSVVRAGLLPALRGGALPGSAEWFVTSMVPGAFPYEELAAALARVATGPVGPVVDRSGAGRGIARAVKAVLPGEHDELLLVVDQFEELFTLCAEEPVRQQFIADLAAAVTDPRSRLRLVLTLRADFYDRPLRYPELASLIEESAVTVSPLAPDELEAAITEPAARSGAIFEPGLVARIVADVVDQPGALPLLQYALTELFDRQVSGVLTTRAYDALGGLSGALARRAERLVQEADAEGVEAIRRLLTRLVALGDGVEDTRRRARRSELGADAATADAIERFGAARILAFDCDPRSREPTVEVAHEAFLRAWPRLRGWLDQDRDGLRAHRHVTASASAWEASGRDPAELYRGGRLDVAEQWAADHAADLNAAEAAFLEASLAQRAATRAAAQRSRRRMRRALVAVATVAVLALVAGAAAFEQRRNARSAAADAERERAAASATAFAAETGRLAALAPTLAGTDLSLSMLLAAEAAGRETSPETLGALLQVLVAADTGLGFVFTDPVRAVFTDGADRLVAFTDRELLTWRLADHAPLGSTVLPTPLRAAGPTNAPVVAFAAGRAAWVDDELTAWTAALEDPEAATRVGSGAAAVALSRDGSRLAIAGPAGEVRLLQLPDLGTVWTIPTDGARTVDEQTAVDLSAYPGLGAIELRTSALHSLAFAPDGQTLVHAYGVLLHTVDVAAGRRRATVDTVHPFGAVHTLSSARVTFGAGAQPALVASANVAMSVYDPATLELRARFNPARRQSVFPTATVGIGEGRLAVLDGGGEVAVISEVDGSVLLGPLPGRVGRGTGLAVTDDLRQLVVAGEEGISFLALDGAGPIRRAMPRRPEQVTVAAGRDGTWFDAEPAHGPVGGGPSSSLDTWDCAGPTGCRSIRPDQVPAGVGLLPDDGAGNGVLYLGTTVAFGGREQLQVIDSADRRPIGVAVVKDGVGQNTVAVAPDRSWIAFDNFVAMAPDTGPSLQVSSLRTGERLAKFPLPANDAHLIAVDPAGRRVLVGSRTTGASFVIDTATWERRPSDLPPGAVTVSAFSPDGRHLVTVDLAGELTLRDAGTFAPIRAFQADAGAANTFAALPLVFSADGRHLVSAHDGLGRLWDVTTGQLIGQPIPSLASSSPSAVPGEHAGFVGTSEQWVQVWRFDVDAWRDLACRLAGRNLTPTEWAQFGPRDAAHRATCAAWP